MICPSCARFFDNEEIRCPFCGYKSEKIVGAETSKESAADAEHNNVRGHRLTSPETAEAKAYAGFSDKRTEYKVPPSVSSARKRRRESLRPVRRDKTYTAPSVLQFFLILFILAIPVVNLIAAACWAIGGANRSRQNLSIAFLIWMSIIMTAFLTVMVIYSEDIYNYIKFLIARLS